MRLVSVIYRIWRGVCAAAKGMRGNTIALCLNWLLGVALQGLRGRRTENNYNSPRYPAVDSYMVDITARPLAVIGAESFALPSEPKGGHMPDSEFGPREWIALKVLTTIFLLLLVALAMVIQW